MNISAPLVNLALLEAMKGSKIVDEIDVFVPYLVLAICKIETEVFDIQDIKIKFIEEFSISPPISALQVILTRAKKQGYVKLTNHQYFKVPGKLFEIEDNSRRKRGELEASLFALISEFKDFAFTKHHKTIEDQEAQSFLYDYITNNISAFIDTLAGNLLKLNTKIKNKDYLTASFIAYLNKEKPSTIIYLDILVKGILLANYISLADKVTTKSSFTNISVYLDTPLILGLMGFSGPLYNQTIQDFINLLRHLNINIYVFELTIDEIEKIFGAWILSFKTKRYTKFNPKTLELLRAKGYDHVSLETEKSMLETRLGNLNIGIKRNFKIDKKYQCNEVALEKELIKAGLNNDLRHDITCVSRIYNSRANKKINTFASNFSIFVTLNPILERSVNEFFKNDEAYTKTIPVVATEKWLATVLWLKKPNLFSNLPRNLLLTHAYSTIYSDDKFWNSFLRRLGDLTKRGDISDNDFILVRWDKNLIEKVHDTSIETGKDFSDQDVYDIVEKIKIDQAKIFREEMDKVETLKLIELNNKDKERELIENQKNKHI